MTSIEEIITVENTKGSKKKLDRLSLSEVWEIITDKRFGIRFKIANIICRDYLRNYLAMVNYELNTCEWILDQDYSYETKIKCIDGKVRRVKKTLNDVSKI